MLYKDPGKDRSETVEIKVNFAMAYGDTQNFSVPIYSGNFAFRVTFSKKQVSVFYIEITQSTYLCLSIHSLIIKFVLLIVFVEIIL